MNKRKLSVDPEEETRAKFVSSLNDSFKRYLDSDDGSLLLPDFETAVIFVLKRKAVTDYLSQQQQQQIGLDMSRVGARVESLEQAVTQLGDEAKALRASLRQAKAHLDKLNDAATGNEVKKAAAAVVSIAPDSTASKAKRGNKLKHSCLIC